MFQFSKVNPRAPRDITAIVAGTTRYNLHTHTQFCDGHDTVAAMADAAASEGFRVLGFSPHSPIPIPSSCNMPAASVADYLAEIEKARQAHPDLMILAGMEVDYLDNGFGPACDFIANLPLDYIIGSVHFLRDRKGGYTDIDGPAERFAEYVGTRFGGDLRGVCELFYETSIKMVRAGGFDIIGHLDKVGRNAACMEPDIEKKQWYRECVKALIDEVIRAGVTVEINTKAHPAEGRVFPDPRWLAPLRRAGVPIIVNSDAHYATRLDAGRPFALSLL